MEKEIFSVRFGVRLGSVRFGSVQFCFIIADYITISSLIAS